MSSCAVSCCTCSPKVSCASGTSAFWPTAGVARPCHFASSCSAQHRKLSKRSHPPMTQICFGSAPNVGDRCGSSKGLRLLKSSFVLHRPRMPSPHEITTDITKPLPASACAVSLCLLLQQISSVHSTFAFSATLPLSPWATVLCRTSPVLRKTYSSLD